jgi:hypothetical protein
MSGKPYVHFYQATTEGEVSQISILILFKSSSGLCNKITKQNVLYHKKKTTKLPEISFKNI